MDWLFLICIEVYAKLWLYRQSFYKKDEGNGSIMVLIGDQWFWFYK